MIKNGYTGLAKCIDNYGIDHLTIGKEYIIQWTADGTAITVNDAGLSVGVHAYRFEVVPGDYLKRSDLKYVNLVPGVEY